MKFVPLLGFMSVVGLIALCITCIKDNKSNTNLDNNIKANDTEDSYIKIVITIGTIIWIVIGTILLH